MKLPARLQPLVERPLLWAVPLVVVIALAGTADMIFDEDVRRLYESNGDIASIIKGAEQAGPLDVLRWHVDVWIEADSPYYRPLVSALFYAEYQFFGTSWRPYCIVSWLMQAGICVLMLLFMARLWSHWSPTRRMLPGILAVALFTIPCETTVDGPHWGNRGIARGLMPYWPSQTDFGALLLSLLSLLLLDLWLAKREKRSLLIGAAAAFVAALGFKEHALILPLLAVALALYRGMPLKPTVALGGAGLAVSVVFLVLRRVFVPEAWSPDFDGPMHVLTKAGIYLCEPLTAVLRIDAEWVVVTSAGLAAAFVVGIWRPRWVWVMVIGTLAALLIPPAAMGGNVALITIPAELWRVWRITSTFIALLIAIEARGRGPTLLLLASLLIIHLPVLHVTGPHYYYWPVAWWSMFNAAVMVSLWGTLKAAGERAKGASGRLGEDEAGEEAGADDGDGPGEDEREP